MRSTRQASELPPLTVDDASGRGLQRLTQPLARQTRSAGPGPRPPPKIYPRLQTLAQLTNNYVRDLHVGNFVARSEVRWRTFDGVDVPNSARNRACNVVERSAALVLQCAWRKHAAISERKRLGIEVWRCQLGVATKITRHSANLTYALHLMNAMALEHRCLEAISSVLSIYGFYLHSPARLLAWWLSFECAKLRGKRILRHPPTIVAAVNILVELTCRKLARLWRCLVPLAAVTIQCRIRAYLARQLAGKKRLARLQHLAAIRLQGFVRAYNAKHMARRVRQRCAVMHIQSWWRCFLACRCLQRRRIMWAVTAVCVPLIQQAARQATIRLRIASAQTIQKHYRGSRARAHVRELVGCNEQLKWRQNPSKGFIFFEQKRYDRAALHLENCFRQGIFAEEALPVAQPSSPVHVIETSQPRRKLASGSRMSFSFSSAPTKLGEDWILDRDNRSSTENANDDAIRLATRLRFWQAYAISHLRVFEATGDLFNLQQACIGWESYLHVDAVADSWTAFEGLVASTLDELRLRSQFELVRCLFWGGKDKDKALALCELILEEINSSTNCSRNTVHLKSADVVEMTAHLLMISSMIYFELARYAICCSQLQKLLAVEDQHAFTEVEIRFTLVLVLLRRYEEAFQDNQKGARGSEESDITTFVKKAAQLLKDCYRSIELWPSVGFYHGWLTKTDAKRLLVSAQIGAFLLHHPVNIGVSEVMWRDQEKSSGKILLQVKLSDQPLHIASMPIELTDDGLYKAPRTSAHTTNFSLHGLIACLPTEAGVNIELGIRKPLLTTVLRKKFVRSQLESPLENESIRSMMLNWCEWERHLNDIVVACSPGSERRWKRTNETWSAVCYEIAKILECSQAWVFAEFCAREALLHSKTHSHRANVCFLAARVAINEQKRPESALMMQQAYLEKQARSDSRFATHLFIDNMTAVQRALSLNISISKLEPFTCRLERIQKLERLCLKAWRYDSLTTKFRGDPFSEAVLLQRISDEMYAECGDTFFIRSLVKAHVRAYLKNDFWFEERHLQCAFAGIARLFERFHKYQDSWTTDMTNLTNHFGDAVLSKSTAERPYEFSVKLMLLSWHHIPFLLCFEIAEVLYRYQKHSTSALIDVYESLLGRIRGSQPRTPMYASYEELILLRLSFLLVARVSRAERSWRHIDAAIATISEILDQRKERARMFTSTAAKKQAKSIQWPSSVRLPFHLSDAEVLFIRGFFTQIREDMMRLPADRRLSWRDYYLLHEEAMDLVRKYPPVRGNDKRIPNSVRYRAENVIGLRVFVGATKGVKIANMLLSQPFVVIRHEGNATLTKTEPSWTNLSPSWEEDVEFPISSTSANIVVSMMNRVKRNSRWQDAQMIGFVSIKIQDLLAARDGITPGKYFELVATTKHHNQGSAIASDKHFSKAARIFLSFQVVLKPRPALPLPAKMAAVCTTRIGNWDVEEVRAHLHGDFQTFVTNRWIWSRFAHMFMEDGDPFIAKWFYLKAVRLTPTLKSRASLVSVRLKPEESLSIAKDLVGLSCCHRVTLSDSRWGVQALPLLGQAETILSRHIAKHDRDYCTALKKQLVAVHTLCAEAQGNPRRLGPLEEALTVKALASSEWIKMTNGDSMAAKYVNQDTGECFSSKWRVEPLEYEDKRMIVAREQQRLPHRIVVMNGDMKARVSCYHRELLRLHDEDPFQWTAVFNERKKEIQFFSPYLPEAYAASRTSKYPPQPPTYVMLADEFILYHVILVQDAYRRYRRIRQRWRRLRGIFVSVSLASLEMVAARRRMFQRSLNCIRVVVNKAQHLRSADLLSSDPFVQLTLTDTTGDVVAAGKTSVCYSSLNPKWNEEFHFRYSFIKHRMQQTAAPALNPNSPLLRDALLTLKVFDYDVITARIGHSKKWKLADSRIISSDRDHLILTKCSNDFLGMVTIPIQPFVWGKLMTADLPLMGENNLSQVQGLLTVSIQWTHCDEEVDVVTNEAKLWTIGSGGGRSLISKAPKPRHKLPVDTAREIDSLHKQMEQLLLQLRTMAQDILYPMQRLHKHLQIAQARGKTADEAKMLEQRLDTLLHTQLLPQQRHIREMAIERINTQLQLVLQKLSKPMDQYVASVDYSLRGELRALVENLKSTSRSFEKAFIETGKPVDAIATALKQHQLVHVWNDRVRQVLKMFFVGDNVNWHFALETTVSELYEKLDKSSHHSDGSHPSEGVVPKRPTTPITVAKRRECIEKVKQEKAWYEL